MQLKRKTWNKQTSWQTLPPEMAYFLVNVYKTRFLGLSTVIDEILINFPLKPK